MPSRRPPSTNVCPNCGSAPAAAFHVPRSPAPELLNSNTAPSESAIPKIQKSILEAQTSISKLNCEIAKLTNALDKLLIKHKDLRKHVASHQNILSPMRKLPAEIWSEIFLFTLSRSGRRFDAKKSPLLLGQVCSDWRHIALSTPRLWSSIQLKNMPRYSQHSDTALVQLWLARSRNLPLSISLSTNIRWITHPVIEAVIPHSHRWEFVDLQLPLSLFASLAPVRNRLPLLRAVKLCVVPSFDSAESISPSLELLECAPKLRGIYLSSCASPFTLKLPWSQVTIGTVVYRTVVECLEVMRLSSNLADFTLESHHALDRFVSDVQDYMTLYPEPFQLRRLCSLHIKVHHAQDLASALQCITSPVLRNFTVESLARETGSWPQQQFMTFLSRSSCSVKKFRLIGISPTEDDLISCLEELPALTHLEVHPSWEAGTFSNRLLNRLTCTGPNDQTCLSPKLELINLMDGDGFSDQMFVDMIESRWRFGQASGRTARHDAGTRVARIACVRLYNRYQPLPLALMRLEVFRREGLDVEYGPIPS